MPRVAQAPRPNNSRAASGSIAASPFKSGVKIPLNDDAQEKAKRMQSRHALHDIQMNQIKAAASPMQRLSNLERAGSSSPSSNPKTPRHSGGRENDLDGLTVGGKAVTPMKRVPILANFEEWMKMATDNKINAANSWNFALIDYFHDMSLLKEGDGVNFQKASCTLDGCVKIYTSRVDSVATETGKLLSGLADSGNSKKKQGENEEGEESEEEVEDEDGVVRKKPKKRTEEKWASRPLCHTQASDRQISSWVGDHQRIPAVAQRSSEATLASSFSAIQLKKFELEFSVDPLFKKASADFDEGGAKGLLLNHLTIDSQGRIVFDSSDDAGDASAEGQATRRKDDALQDEDEAEPDSMLSVVTEEVDNDDEDVEINIEALGAKFFLNLDQLEGQEICPSLKNFDLGDPSGSMDVPFLKAPEDWRQEKDKPSDMSAVGDKSGIFLDDDNPIGFEDDDDGLLGNFDIPADAGFGEGGEAWARDAAIETRMRVHDAGLDNDGMGGGDGEDGEGMGNLDSETNNYAVSLDHGAKIQPGHEDILSYFDEALQKNWAGPEHWRIRKIKDINKPATTAKARKDKEPFEIDFLLPLSANLAETIYTQASSNTVISLPKKDWKSKTKNLLPDDKHFNSKQLLRLFLKPKARMRSRRSGFGAKAGMFGQLKEEEAPEGEMDEGFWARKEGPTDPDDVAALQGDYDANFFDDGLPMPGGIDDDDDMEFADAREHFSPGIEGGQGGIGGINNMLNGGITQAAEGEGAFGMQLVTQSRRLRPEYVQYARVAKKVDVRRLKEELWKGMGIDTADQPPIEANKDPDSTLKFTTVMQNLRSVYPKQAMDDISTSYCFICLLHLANEKGLVIEKQEGLTELSIRKDPTAEITVGG
ncbi:Condensin complex subunit 2 [Venustampulla echinocandica]|uniref:Condensin complex subunit 2 n=1 Tax=Venustampulla echinocandica TaxID=2656787 RepID=A0A370TMF8_9HELO|nr:Condensin complex subunit 2 [Venustampulla echinocandica]RDL36695.1 Condensin complex subunit 2 [Venustampulla echinocandica]